MDVVIEGDAVRVGDEEALQRVAAAYASKYKAPFRFAVQDGVFVNEEGGEALVYRLEARKAFAFGKGESFSQTRWRFR
jgi:hypothetical protein